MPIRIFGKNLKTLVLVGKPYLVKPLLDYWLLLWKLKNKDGE